MRNIILSLIIVFSLAKSTFATEQIPDLIIIKGDTLNLYSNPLKDFIDKKPINTCQNTACLRGYQAIWRISGDSLFFDNIRTCCYKKDYKILDINEFISNVNKYFVKNFFRSYSGVLKIYKGELLRQVNLGYGSIYSSEIHLKVKKGKVENVRNIDNISCNGDCLPRRNLLQLHQITLEYLNKNFNWNNVKGMADSTEQIPVRIKIGKNGKIKSCQISNALFCKNICKLLVEMPSFEILKQSGRPIDEHILLNLKFDLNKKIIKDQYVSYYFKENW